MGSANGYVSAGLGLATKAVNLMGIDLVPGANAEALPELGSDPGQVGAGAGRAAAIEPQHVVLPVGLEEGRGVAGLQVAKRLEVEGGLLCKATPGQGLLREAPGAGRVRGGAADKRGPGRGGPRTDVRRAPRG